MEAIKIAGGQALRGADLRVHQLPVVFHMLQRLAAGRAMAERIFLVDTVDEALAVLGG